ncbi:hypothetical protein JQ616_29540 [Bradyrhizobium tropiciagri]|nr:hypothetical protein [Bradyrhizobium tropiciagri]
MESRRDAARFAAGNNAIDGGVLLPETEAALDEWTRGVIDDDELLARTLRRFGGPT